MRKLWLIGALALLVSLFTVSIVAAADPPVITVGTAQVVVGTTAQVGMNGTPSDPPAVLYKWELPDMNANMDGIQYIPASGADMHDDDVAPGIQFFPYLDDYPAARMMEFWWVVSDPFGIANISNAFVRVLRPDGSLKFQLHATAAPGFLAPATSDALVRQPCSVLDATSVGSLGEAAVHTAQLTTGNISEIVTQCNKGTYAIFRAWGPMSKLQPAGVDTVVASASNQFGQVGSLTNTIVDLPISGWKKDFTAVSFGNLLPETHKVIPGDETFGTSGFPTVENTGNVPLYVNLHFRNMVGTTYQKIIDIFDVRLGTVGSTGGSQIIDPIMASENVCFGSRPLASNVPTQIDFSVRPGPVPADTYTGGIDMWGTLACPAPAPAS